MKWSFIPAVFLAVYILQVLAEVWLELLNIEHTRRWSDRVPPSFEGFVDGSVLGRATAYTLAKSRLGIAGGLVNEVLVLVMILSGFLAAMERLLSARDLPLIVSGLLFFFIPGLILYLVGLPFDYYHAFVIEERFGFNRTTRKMWIADQLKSGIISLVLFSLLLSLVLWTLRAFPASWWIWGALIVSAVQLGLAVLYPVLIAPLFNKFEPVKDEVLAARIRGLMEENGIRVKRVLQMNAGVRSRHSNAHFTGLGRTKQIVLYDTLIDSHSHEEILSVLAHEIGHFKRKHIVKQLILFQASVWIGFYLTYLLLDRPLLYASFGFDAVRPYVGLFLLAIFWQKLAFFLRPFPMALSRRFEREADVFAAELLHSAAPLASSLKKMAADNLANLNPHPLYVRFHYSHPPLAERITLLEAPGSGT